MSETNRVPERFTELVYSGYTKYTDLTADQVDEMLEHPIDLNRDYGWTLIARDTGVNVWYIGDRDTENDVCLEIELKGCGSWQLQLKYKSKEKT